MGLFGGNESRNAALKASARVPRMSSGWTQMLKSLRELEGQRVLDFGPTSPANINFLTGLGHSIYMANPVGEAEDERWKTEDGSFPVKEFLAEHLEFSGREFDTVLFWDTADYLPQELRAAVVSRLHKVLVPGGQLLAFFHVKPETGTHRYHLRDDGQVEAQYTSDAPVRSTLNNRQVEQLFAAYTTYKFFLAKDNLREVLVTR